MKRPVDDNTKARIGLLALPHVGPARLRWLLSDNEPGDAWNKIKRGRFPVASEHPPVGVNVAMLAEWAGAARTLDLEGLVDEQLADDRHVLTPDDLLWPFTDDPEPPTLLFYQGRIELLHHEPAVAVVGTRRCTSVGRNVAYSLGCGFADAGTAVVSGLALGIDGAAHRGSLDHEGYVVGVVGSGLDVVYPGANRRLWAEVSSRGLLLSESLAGARPQRWRFPARNRLIAALSRAVVVVESHEQGGSLSTVDECLARDRSVFVIPGSVTSPASDGVNRLLIEGAIPARNVADVLGPLGYSSKPVARPESAEFRSSAEPKADRSPLHRLILDEVAVAPVSIDTLIAQTGRAPREVVTAIQELVVEAAVEIDGSTVSVPSITS